MESAASGPFRAAPGRTSCDVAVVAGVVVAGVAAAAAAAADGVVAGVAAGVDEDGDGAAVVAAAEQRGPRCGCSGVVAVVGCCRCCSPYPAASTIPELDYSAILHE